MNGSGRRDHPLIAGSIRSACVAGRKLERREGEVKEGKWRIFLGKTWSFSEQDSYT